MELYHQILAEYFASSQKFDQEINTAQIVEGRCYQTLLKIKQIVENDGLSDDACFQRIEEIVCLLEDLGSNAGSRHDFG